MDAGAHEPARARPHGLGLSARLVLLGLAVLALATGIAGGLARLGMPVLSGPATAFHGALMIAGFLGTVISLERAIALSTPLAYSAPLASGIGAVAILAGWTAAGFAAWILAALALVIVSAAIVRRQRAAHTVLLAVAAFAWLCANLLYALGGAPPAVIAGWFAFLVLTIAAERLEMTRLMKRRALAAPLFAVAVGAMLFGAVVSAFDEAMGAIVYGAALVALAAWLFTFDIARRTVRTTGFARYAAVALLGGYAWLAVAGVAWAARPFLSLPLRDLALHALGLGFVVSMIFAHAPIVVPVIAKRAMRFTPLLYAPLVLLHASLLVRFAVPLDPQWRLWGGVLNAATLVVFATMVALGLRARRPAPA